MQARDVIFQDIQAVLLWCRCPPRFYTEEKEGTLVSHLGKGRFIQWSLTFRKTLQKLVSDPQFAAHIREVPGCLQEKLRMPFAPVIESKVASPSFPIQPLVPLLCISL